MLNRWFLHGLLWISLVSVLLAAGYWWWSVQPDELAPAVVETRSLTLENGLEVTLIADPDATNARLNWRWHQGSVHEPSRLPGLHRLFADVLLYGETASGYRHLATRARRDPAGAVELRAGRLTTEVNYRRSSARFAEGVQYFTDLLDEPAYPLEGVAVERQHLSRRQAGLDYLLPAEWEALVSSDPDIAPSEVAAEFWSGMSDVAIARELARYGSDHLVPGRMQVRLVAPMTLSELEQLAVENFGALHPGNPVEQERRSRATPFTQGQWLSVSDDETDPTEPVPALRFLYPWEQQSPDGRPEEDLVRWLNATYEQSPQRRLHQAGTLGHLEASATDDGLLVSFYANADDARVDGTVARATLERFLTRVTGTAPASESEGPEAPDVASDLELSEIALDLGRLTVFDHQGDAPEDASLPPAAMDQALALDLPVENRTRPEAVPDLTANDYELVGWQPQRLVNSETLQFWHYEDNRFGTPLVSAHVRVHWPIGPDAREQDRWQRWARTAGPGWTDEVLWASQTAQSRAEGLQVTADSDGLVWHFTAHRSLAESWLMRFQEDLDQHAVDLPPAAQETRADVALMRERAEWTRPEPPSTLAGLPNTLLLMGRLTPDEAQTLADRWQEDQTVAGQALPETERTPFQLDRAHRIAEIEVPGARSAYSRSIQLPENSLRHRTLAGWTLPWIEEALNTAVRTENFSGDLSVEEVTPLGYPMLRLELTSRTQDPARLGLYARAFHETLEDAVDNLDPERFQDSTEEQAALLREPARSVSELASYHWQDIHAGRRHFNGRERQAGVLEGTSIDGWRFFVDEWLFGNSARQLSVFEIGETWRSDYRDARALPSGARAW